MDVADAFDCAKLSALIDEVVNNASSGTLRIDIWSDIKNELDHEIKTKDKRSFASSLCTIENHYESLKDAAEGDMEDKMKVVEEMKKQHMTATKEFKEAEKDVASQAKMLGDVRMHLAGVKEVLQALGA